MDGLSLIQNLRDAGMHQTKVFVSTFICTPDIIRQVNDLNISRFFVKPYDISSVGEQIAGFHLTYELRALPAERNRDLHNLIVNHLKYLGAPMQIKGYPMLVEAIYLAVQEPERVHAITSALYPKVGEACHATGSQVERNLRHIVERIWDRCRVEVMEEYFGNSLDMTRDKPNNSEFIATVAEHIRNQIY